MIVTDDWQNYREKYNETDVRWYENSACEQKLDKQLSQKFCPLTQCRYSRCETEQISGLAAQLPTRYYTAVKCQ
jgi:hypothetical protein